MVYEYHHTCHSICLGCGVRSGAYWQPAMQPAEQMTTIAAQWEQHRESFAAEFADLQATSGVDTATLGERLQRVAQDCGAAAHPFGGSSPPQGGAAGPRRTLIHGDPKAANFFFRSSAAKGQEAQDLLTGSLPVKRPLHDATVDLTVDATADGASKNADATDAASTAVTAVGLIDFQVPGGCMSWVAGWSIGMHRCLTECNGSYLLVAAGARS